LQFAPRWVPLTHRPAVADGKHTTLVLLVGAGLLFRTIHRMSDTNPGFDTQHVITFKVGFSPSVTKTASGMRTAYRQLLERLRTLPGVQAADFTYILPLKSRDNVAPFWIGSQMPAVVRAAPRMMVFDTGPDYLRAMSIPLLRGRFFSPKDTTNSPCVAAIDDVLASTYFRGQDPLGQTITFGWTPPWALAASSASWAMCGIGAWVTKARTHKRKHIIRCIKSRTSG
jgi:hypothetical protein